MNVFQSALLTGCFLILFIQDVTGQHPVYRHYTVDDGLPSTEIYHVIQDSRGFVWIATNMGVSRYDGRHFQNFDKQDGLPENTVFEIYEDSVGRVWFVSFPCQLSYFLNDSIYHYKYNEVLKSNIGNYAVPVKYSFVISDHNDVRIGLLYEGLISINKDGKLSKLHPTGEHSRSAHLFVQKDRVLVSQGEIMDLYNLVLHWNGQTFNCSFKNEAIYYTHRQLMAIRNDPEKVLFAQNNFMVSLSMNMKPLIKYTDFRIFGLYRDREGNIWTATDKNGAICYKKGDINSEPIHHLLNGISVSAILQDSEGGMWFSTLTEGLFYLHSDSFLTYTTDEGLSSNIVNTVALTNKGIVIGTNDEFVNFPIDGKMLKTRVSNTKNDRIQVLFVDQAEQLWVGTNEYLYNIMHTGVVHKYFNTKYDLSEKSNGNEKSRNIFSIKTISNSNDGGIWIGESNCFSKFRNGKVVYNSVVIDNAELRSEAVLQLEDNTLFIGTPNGLWKYTNGKLFSSKDNNPLLRSRITDIKYYKPLGILMLGTKGAGLLIYDMKDSIKQILRSNGLSSNSVSSLLLLDNYLWIGTNFGLNVLDINKIGKKDFKITSYFKLHGLISNEINEIQGDANNIYIATNHGLTVFNYKAYRPQTKPPPIYLSSFSIMKEKVKIKSGYRLKHNQNLITIDYIGISFRDGGSLKYKYRLKGPGADWNYTQNTNVEYAFLPSGDYHFEVVAINSYGIESIAPASISFTIKPPFWRTWWFILFMVAVFGAFAYLYYINRLKHLKKEHDLRFDINWFRQQALARQMDPHFVFNTLNSIQSFIIKNDRLASTQYLSKFSKLMRLILNNSQKQAVPVTDEIAALTLYLELESLRFQQKFEYQIIVDPELDSSDCLIPAFLVQPFVENAIWHGIMGLKGVGRIKIELTKINNLIECVVEDNGIGRVKSQELKTTVQRAKQSYGTSLVESRLKLLNNLYDIDMQVQFVDLYHDDGNAVGTRVIINLPIIS